MAGVTAAATRTGARGALIPPHSMASKAMPTEITTRNSQPPHQAANRAVGTRTTAEAILRPRLDQSKRLACGKGVIGHDSPVAAGPRLELAGPPGPGVGGENLPPDGPAH